MTSPSEKHIYAAKAALTDGYDDLVKSIATALANAEREGMTTAADILMARLPMYASVAQSNAVRECISSILSESERA